MRVPNHLKSGLKIEYRCFMELPIDLLRWAYTSVYLSMVAAILSGRNVLRAMIEKRC